MSLMQVNDIQVFASDVQMVAPISVTLEAGKAVTFVGETGSGKSLFAQAILGTLPKALTATGQITLAGQALDASKPEGIAAFWGKDISILPQEPWLALNPLKRAKAHVQEVYQLVRSDAGAAEKANEDLKSFGLESSSNAFPFQLSGGMAQRLAIAAARAGGADIVVADEPTKGLDVARRDDVAAQLQKLLKAGGSLLTVTHDLELAAALGGEVIVFRKGQVVERGPAEKVLTAPDQDYTQSLLDAEPKKWPSQPSSATSAEVIRCEDVTVARGQRVLFEGVTESIHAGEVVGLCGPSGVGKSSLGDCLLGVLSPKQGAVTRQAGVGKRRYQKLWQDPPAAFPTYQTLGKGLRDLMRLHRVDPKKLPPLLERLNLRSELLDRPPSDVSGGELQRLSIARALLLDPVFLFADEPTSRLDPLTQKSVIDALVEAAKDSGIALLIVSHDTALIDAISDRKVELQPVGASH